MSMPDEGQPTVEWVRDREPHPVHIPERMRDTVKAVKHSGCA